MRLRALALAAVAALVLPAPAAAACRPRTSPAALEDQVMCLVCGVPLALAEAPQADRERALIAREIARCRSAAQIKAELVAQYGPRVLALPQAHGFRVTAYLVPPAAALLALAGLATVAVRRRVRAPGGAAAPLPALDARDAARLDAELDRYR